MIQLNEERDTRKFTTEKGNGLVLHENPVFCSWSGELNPTMTVEMPVAVGRGYYDIGFLGAGTFINIQRLRDATTACRIEAKSIGRFCSISDNVHIGFSEHSTSFVSPHPIFRYDASSDWLDGWFPKQHDEWENYMGMQNKKSYRGGCRESSRNWQ